jgi:hypothetical protein
MTLGNMRANGVRSLAVSCMICHHPAALAVETRPGAILRPAHGLHRLPDHRRRCSAELERAATAILLDGQPMSSRANFTTIAAGLTVPERVFLFCIASDTDWFRAGVANSVAHLMMVKGLVEREGGAGSYVLTDEGRAVLAALLGER